MRKEEEGLLAPGSVLEISKAALMGKEAPTRRQLGIGPLLRTLTSCSAIPFLFSCLWYYLIVPQVLLLSEEKGELVDFGSTLTIPLGFFPKWT